MRSKLSLKSRSGDWVVSTWRHVTSTWIRLLETRPKQNELDIKLNIVLKYS